MGTSSPSITLLQHNLGKGKTASAELRNVAHHIRASALLVQEPWVSRQAFVCGLGTLSNRILTGTRDDVPRACIAILDPALDVTILRHLSSANCVCAHLITEIGSFYLVSLYCPPSEDILLSIATLRRIHTVLGRVPIIVGADLNAKSPLWYSRHPDQRGRMVEDFLAETGWQVRNEIGNPCTFSSANGRSNIDVTMTSPQAWRLLRTWRVMTHWTCSDHRVIQFTLGSRTVSAPIRTLRYNTSKTHWATFLQMYEDLNVTEPPPPTCDREVETLADAVTLHLQLCADSSTPRKTRFPRSVPWWTGHLTRLKQRCHRLRRRLQRQRDPDQREALRIQYNQIRRRYSREVQQAKTASWRAFITEQGNDDPYGIAYRVIRKRVTVDEVMADLRTDVGHTRTWGESARCLLTILTPDDLPGAQPARGHTAPPQAAHLTRRWTADEVTQVIKSLPKRKAPGHDGIETAMLRRLADSPTFIRNIHALYTGCLAHRCFPTIWKHGVVRAILKNDNKDPTDPRSYRPICLLPFLGKVLERLIKKRLTSTVMHPDYASPHQFGFRKGRSAEDAIHEVRQMVASTQTKYAVAILFDVSAAFDNLRWDSVLDELALRNCPTDLLGLLRSYLCNRTVELRGTFTQTTKSLTKGCPQGSILGPDLWNLVLDGLLRQLTTAHCAFVAYADDLIILLTENSRLHLEQTGQAMCDLVSLWFRTHHLTVSPTKTEMVTLRGQLRDRPPTIRLDGETIRMVRSARYLGVHLTHNFHLSEHLAQTGDKCKTVFTIFGQLARTTWGLKYPMLKLYYQSIFIPTIAYAVGAWGDRIGSRCSRQILSIQRFMLLRITKAYRTVSTDALQVIAGIPPLDLVLQQLWRIAQYSRRGVRTFQDLDLPPQLTKAAAIRRIKQDTLVQWERRWANSAHADITHTYFPTVTSRLAATWLRPHHALTQCLSGHGNFQAKLHSRGLTDSPLCRCGEQDTAPHAILQCHHLDDIRLDLQRAAALHNIDWPPALSVLVSRPLYDTFSIFTTEMELRRRTVPD